MNFRKFYEDSIFGGSGKVFVAIDESEESESFVLIDAETLDILDKDFQTENEAEEYAKQSNLEIVDGVQEDVDLLNLSEEELEDMGCIIIDEEDAETLEFDEVIISERLVRKKVIRGGKRLIKIKTDRAGYKVVRDGGRVKEVRISQGEKRKRMRGQRVGGRKRKAKSQQIQRKRKLSLRKRKSFG